MLLATGTTAVDKFNEYVPVLPAAYKLPLPETAPVVLLLIVITFVKLLTCVT